MDSFPISTANQIQVLEQALRAAELRAATAEQRLIDITNQLEQGVLLVDATGTIVAVNERYCELSGLVQPPSYWVGQPDHHLAAQLRSLTENPEAHLQRIAQLRVDGQSVTGEEIRLCDGRIYERDYLLLPDKTGAGPAELIFYRDVTQQRRAAAALDSMSRIPAQNPNPVIRLSFSNQLLFANAASRLLWRKLPWVGRQRLIRELRQATATTLANDIIDRREMAVGNQWFTASVVPYPQEGYVNIYLSDVTDRHQAEAALRQRETELREQQEFIQLILDTTPSAIFVRNAQGKVLFQNRTLADLRAQAFHIEKTHDLPLDTARAQELQRYDEADAQVLSSGGQIITEDPLTLSTGEVRWFQSVKRPLRRPDGRVDVLIVSTDVTDIKLTRQTLEHSEKQYRDLMQYSPAIIVTHDMEGVLLSCNPASEAILQVGKEEIIGHSLTRFLPADYQSLLANYLTQMTTSREWSGIFSLKTRSDEPRHLLCHNYRVDEPGQPSYVIAHGQDITERLLAERAMQRAKEEAEMAVRAREHFLANMSHEIRTPMNGVLGMARQLTKTPLNTHQQELLAIITSSGQHLLSVLNDILDMAKISSGKLEMAQVAFNLCDSMGEAIQPLLLQATEKGITVKGTLLRESCPMPWVIGDAYRLNQILINLLSNAIKFTPSGGQIMVGGYLLEETETHLTTEFRVTDTGIGIAADKLAYIFEDFTQAYADTARQFGGTGLGLSICRELVAQLGGTLTVESELGRGSTFQFTVTLPRAHSADVAARLPHAAFDNGELRGQRVLLVEDNEINRDVARLSLEDWGVLVDEAEDGATALALHAKNYYAAILMDIQMPGMSGVEATIHIRQHPEPQRAQVPILALTANAFSADNERYIAAGMNDYLTKPFEEAELYHKLVRLFSPRTLPSYNLTHLRESAHGKEAFVHRVVRSFLTHMPTTVEHLRTAAGVAQWNRVAELVHHIKPNITQLGIADAQQAVQLLEQVPKLETTDDEERTTAVRHLIQQLEQALRDLPRELPPSD